MKVEYTSVGQGAQKRLRQMVDNARPSAIRAFIDRDVYTHYKYIQAKRWITENASEGDQWHILKDDRYKKWKAREYGSDPKTGRPLLYASGKLYQSVIGPGEGFHKLATERGLTITTSIPYAKGVDDLRSFTTYRPETIRALKKLVSNFIIKNIRAGYFK